MSRYLIIRFNQIGDILQTMSVVGGIMAHDNEATVDWVASAGLAPLTSIDPRIRKTWCYQKRKSTREIVQLALSLRREGYTHIYDAQCSLRSFLIKSILRIPFRMKVPHILTRRKHRFRRFLLFHFHINRFEKPFRAARSFQKPLECWGIHSFPAFTDWHFPETAEKRASRLNVANAVVIVPSAAWENKRWPVEYWKRLIQLLPKYHFLILGGREDTFCSDIAQAAPAQAINLAGETSLVESCCITARAAIVVSGDTGFLHAADLFQRPVIALMGPSAFGYPSAPSSLILTQNLPCQPCTKSRGGRCTEQPYKRCLMEITPERVAYSVKALFSSASSEGSNSGSRT